MAARIAALVLLAIVFLSPWSVAQGRKDPRLEEAARLLRAGPEDEIRRGAELCAEIDDAAAIELLLEALDSDRPHLRDIVWEALPRFLDRYARLRVATELERNRKNELTRQWCAQLLGQWGGPTHADVLVKALGDKIPAVRAAAAQALGRTGAASALKPLGRLANDREPHVRAYTREALVRLDPAGQAALLREGLADTDAGVRCFLLGCVPALLPEELEQHSGAGLADADWRVRLQAAQNLAGARTRSSIEALIGAVEDRRPIVRHGVEAALVELTGLRWTKPEQWRRWWAAEREGFEPAPATAEAAEPGPAERTVAVRYNDLPVESDHVGFLIDGSAQMRARLRSREGTKAEAALVELARVLGLLEGQLVCNAYVYDTEVRAFAKQPAELSARTARKISAFVEDAAGHGAKDIYKALVTVLQDTELDTLYLLASGEPEVGLYVHYNRIVENLRELERFHKVVVHGVVYNESDWYRKQIEEICKATGGEFRAID